MGVARVADAREPLPGGDPLALLDHGRAGLEVHERVVAPVVAADHDVVAGAVGLVGAPVHDPGDAA